MQGLGDSYYGMPYSKYLTLVKSLGFNEIYSETFDSDEVKGEQFKVFWRNGLLLTAESYGRGGDTILNSTKLYANYKVKEYPDFLRGFSGGWTYKSQEDFREQCIVPIIEPLKEELKKKYGTWACKEAFAIADEAESNWMKTNGFTPVLSGYKDVRIGLKHTLSTLELQAEILPKWVENNYLWLCHYMDEKKDFLGTGYYDGIAIRKMKMFPKEIQAAICLESYIAIYEERKAKNPSW
jgi:hypothetical protein